MLHSTVVGYQELNQIVVTSLLHQKQTHHSLPDGIQNHHNGLPFVQAHSNFAPCMSLDGDDFQQLEGVKSNLRNV